MSLAPRRPTGRIGGTCSVFTALMQMSSFRRPARLEFCQGFTLPFLFPYIKVDFNAFLNVWVEIELEMMVGFFFYGPVILRTQPTWFICSSCYVSSLQFGCLRFLTFSDLKTTEVHHTANIIAASRQRLYRIKFWRTSMLLNRKPQQILHYYASNFRELTSFESKLKTNDLFVLPIHPS